jgi:hypothetical protein
VVWRGGGLSLFISSGALLVEGLERKINKKLIACAFCCSESLGSIAPCRTRAWGWYGVGVIVALVIWQCGGRGRYVVLRYCTRTKNPVNRSLQGIWGSMGAVCGGCRRQFGDLVVWWTCGGVRGVWCRGIAKSHKNKHKPCKLTFTGRRGRRGDGMGWALSLLW